MLSRAGWPTSRAALRCAAAMLAACLLLPVAALGAGCGCDSTSCSIHHGRAAAEAAEPACHSEAPAESARCQLVAPCPHASDASRVLLLPPAVLSVTPVLAAPVDAARSLPVLDSQARLAPRSAPELPPRLPAA